MNRIWSDETRRVAARLNLWLVDDNEEFRQGFDMLLRRQFGFQRIQQFGSAEAAIEALEKSSGPDAVLLDVKLPGMSGEAAVGIIKAKSPATRIYLFSTYFDVGCASRSLAAGAAAYFTKHEHYDEVVAAVCAGQLAQVDPRHPQPTEDHLPQPRQQSIPRVGDALPSVTTCGD